MNNRLSAASEDYLKVLYELGLEGKPASTTRIAERMGVTPASATGMVQKLASTDPPLVSYRKHHGAALTPAGEKAALEVIRHHRLLETYLQEKLGYSWDEVHEEADRLEHVISEDFEERIAEALENPSFDPHGDPIPGRDFQMPEQKYLRLSDLGPGEAARVQRIYNEDPALLRYLATIGVTPDRALVVEKVSPFDENMHLSILGNHETIVLGKPVTDLIFVERR